MKPVDQSIVCSNNGDCMRAACASLLELDLMQVPNFIMFNERWFRVMEKFYQMMGYDLGHNYADVDDMTYELSIGGFFYASVPSLTYKNCSHAVVLDMNGHIAHDPNPNKIWQGKHFYDHIDKGRRYFHTFKLNDKNLEIQLKTLDNM